MKLALKLIAAMLAGMIITYVTLIDTLLKQVIEQQGSQLLKAKVDVAAVEFHLLPLSLTIRGIAATNPREPLRNIVTADTIVAKPKPKSLLQRRFIVENLLIQNLRFNQRRESSGAIAGLTPEITRERKKDIDTDSLSEARQLILNAVTPELNTDMDNLRNQATELATQWQQRRTTLINTSNLNDYKNRWINLQKADAKAKLDGFRKLENAIKIETDNLLASKNALNSDIDAVKNLQQQALFAIEQQVMRGKTMTARSKKSSLAESLLAEKIKSVTGNLIGLLISGNAREQGTTNPAIRPAYIKRVELNGYLDFGGDPLPFEGSLRYFYYGIEKIKHVTKFSIKSTQLNNGSLFFSGIIDQRKAENLNCFVTLELADVPVLSLSLADSKEFRVVVGKGLMNIDGKLRLKNQQLKLGVDTAFRNAQLTVETNPTGSSNAIESVNAVNGALADSLRSMDRFNIKLTANGAMNNPSIEVSSSLDQLLKTSTEQQTTNDYETLRPQLVAELTQTASGSINALASIQQELETISADINAHQQALNNLLAPF